MSRNPFRLASPINNPSRFIGRKDELGEILDCLQNGSLDSVSIVGERRIGKTSLLKVLQVQSLDAHFIYLDLQMIKSKHTPTDFWRQVLHNLPRRLLNDDLKATLSELRQAKSYDSFELDHLFKALGNAGLSIVLLLDEFERLANHPNFDPDFFYELRALVLEPRLALVTTTQSELAKLSLSDEKDGASPFFNIFDIVHLGSFKPHEVSQFFDHYLAGTNIHFTSEERDFLFSIAGLHPYYLTVGGRLLFDASVNLPLLEERRAYVKRRFTDKVQGALRYSWSHTDEVERIYLTTLALLSLSESAANFSKKRVTNYYYTTDGTLERLIRRAFVIEQKENVAIFSSVFAQWIRNELRDRQPAQKAYDAWLNDTETQSSLQYIKKSLLSQVTERLLPVIKPHYRDWVISWLTNAPNVKRVVGLLQMLKKEPEYTPQSVLKPLIMTEGKTDWKHLKVAWLKLKAAGHYPDVEIVFEEYEDNLNMGSGELKNLCQHSSKIYQSRAIICIFDRDEAKIIKQVTDKNQAYKEWGNNVFSFIIPLPDHRVATPNISIEFYYRDDEIKHPDEQGRRLFLSDEFHPSSRHKRADLTCTDLNKINRKDLTIIDDKVFDKHHQNVALPKNQFADYILQQEEGFHDFDVSEFQKIFDIIATIIE